MVAYFSSTPSPAIQRWTKWSVNSFTLGTCTVSGRCVVLLFRSLSGALPCDPPWAACSLASILRSLPADYKACCTTSRACGENLQGLFPADSCISKTCTMYESSPVDVGR